MERNSRLGSLILPVTTAVATVLGAGSAQAIALQPSSGIVIHSSAEVLSRYVTRKGDALVFQAPNGTEWPLQIDPGTLGDGTFHPYAEATVREAIQSLDFDLTGIPVEVFILPFPRLGLSSCNAASGCIFLSPGIREVSAEEIHSVTSHEIGHLVQAALMPDNRKDLWDAYRRMRGITDVAAYSQGAEHSFRPHEIFAEDFRFLFGDAAAHSSGTLENGSLALPGTDVQAFMRALRSTVSQRAARPALTNAPNPFPSRTVLSFVVSGTYGDASGAAQACRLDIVGIDGRVVRHLCAGQYVPGTYRVTFDGRDEAGNLLAGGVWFARLAAGGQATSRKLLLTR